MAGSRTRAPACFRLLALASAAVRPRGRRRGRRRGRIDGSVDARLQSADVRCLCVCAAGPVPVARRSVDRRGPWRRVLTSVGSWCAPLAPGTWLLAACADLWTDERTGGRARAGTNAPLHISCRTIAQLSIMARAHGAHRTAHWRTAPLLFWAPYVVASPTRRVIAALLADTASARPDSSVRWGPRSRLQSKCACERHQDVFHSADDDANPDGASPRRWRRRVRDRTHGSRDSLGPAVSRLPGSDSVRACTEAARNTKDMRARAWHGSAGPLV
ncbi:hypothetical protein BC628DRAFT_385466 [Trametes gibbosa]|nr:hypothetical protein BC628DRAFT_385466 [Trametes gibbosa]